MPQARYEWNGPRPANIDAQTAGEHIEALIEKHDEHLTPEEIVADARSTRSPLHSAFMWDDTEAAERHRRQQAKTIMKTLSVKSKLKKKTRAFVFVNLPKHDKMCYVSLRSAMAQPELKAQVIERAYKQLERWIGSYGGNRALRSIHNDVERLRRRIEIEYLVGAGIR